MRKQLSFITAAALAVGGINLGIPSFSFADHHEEKAKEAGQSAMESGEKSGEAAKAGAKEAGKSARNATDKAGDKPQQAGEKMGDAAERSGDKASGAAGSAQHDLTQQVQQAQGSESFKSELRTKLSSNPAVRNFERDEDKGDIENALAKVTSAAAENFSFDDIRESLATADRKRLEKDDFAAVAQLRDEWKSKYGDDLKIRGDQLLSDDAQLVQAEVRDPALLPRWPLDASNQAGAIGSNAQIGTPGAIASPGARDDAMTAGARSGTTPAAGAPGPVGLGALQDKDLKQGDKIAIVRLPSQKNLPELTVSMVQQDGDWKLDIPDHLDARQLRSNLREHLEQVQQDKDSWPDDKDKAQRYLTHQVLMALYDVDASSGAAGQIAD